MRSYRQKETFTQGLQVEGWKKRESDTSRSPYKAGINKGILLVRELKLRKENISLGEEERKVKITVND